MPPTGYFIDAGLLVLLVVGGEGRAMIDRHRRLRGAFTADDYDLLLELTGRVDRILVTPNTLTEASNLLAQHREPERSRLMDRIGRLIHTSEEIVIASAEASSHSQYRRLGLTDAALLEAATPDLPVLTVDVALYRAATRRDREAAVNFNHHRGL